jgi:hypothetical protein
LFCKELFDTRLFEHAQRDFAARTASDPASNTLTIKWWQYADADTYPGTVTFSAAGALTTTFQVPADAGGSRA